MIMKENGKKKREREDIYILSEWVKLRWYKLKLKQKLNRSVNTRASVAVKDPNVATYLSYLHDKDDVVLAS
jgi:hypothetical protein